MVMQKNKRKLIVLVIILLITLSIFISVISPIYTKYVFESLATKKMFPEYSPADLDTLCDLYGSLSEVGVDGDVLNNEPLSFYLRFYLGQCTNGWLYIYPTVDDAKDAFWGNVSVVERFGDSGCFIINTDDFKVFVTQKKREFFSDFTTNNFQCIYVQNGTNFYEISKSSSIFSIDSLKSFCEKKELDLDIS